MSIGRGGGHVGRALAGFDIGYWSMVLAARSSADGFPEFRMRTSVSAATSRQIAYHCLAHRLSGPFCVRALVFLVLAFGVS